MVDSERVPAVVVRHGEGESIAAAGAAHLFKLTGEQTGGLLGFEEFEIPPATVGAHPHIHHGHDEYFYVLDGELTLATDAGDIVLQRGDLPAAPRGAVHGFRNANDSLPVRALCIYTPPGGLARMFVHADLSEGSATGRDAPLAMTRLLQRSRLRPAADAVALVRGTRAEPSSHS